MCIRDRSRFPESRKKPYVFAHPRGHDVVGARDCAFVLVNRLSDLTEYQAV